MALKIEEALALKPGDRVKDYASEYVVIDVTATGPEQFRVNLTREDWEPDNGTYFTEAHLERMSLVAKAAPAEPVKTEGDPAKTEGGETGPMAETDAKKTASKGK